MANTAECERGDVRHELTDNSSNALAEFLTELGGLSRRYGLGLTEGATVYLMTREDYDCEYDADDESRLSFV